MKIHIYSADQFKVSQWSGGSTKQLFIHPTTSEYQLRNFDFRLSTATVEAERSEFTLLPDTSRKLMVLDGSIVLQHEGQVPQTLNKFQVHSFSGELPTTSVGKCTDFNLMAKNNVKGDLDSCVLEKDDLKKLPVPPDCKWYFVFVNCGNILLKGLPEEFNLRAGELLMIEDPSKNNITAKGNDDSEMVLTTIYTQLQKPT